MSAWIVVCLLALAGLRPQSAAPATQDAPPATVAKPFRLQPEELLAHVCFLAHPRMRGRGAGSEEEALAAVYIATQFAAQGLEPALGADTWEQPFEFVRGGKPVDGELSLIRVQSRNVIARLPGTDPQLAAEHIVLGAHFDHLGVGDQGAIYHGADDNASGIAGLLGVAKILAQGPKRPRRSVVFLAFGSEEVGLVGSRHYTSQPVLPLEQALCMINLDMIGRPTFFDIKGMAMAKSLAKIQKGPGVGVVGGEHAPSLLEIARAAAIRAELPLYAPQDFPALVRKQIEALTAGRADHVPFQEKRVPCLFFSTSEHDDYHKPTDTVETVDAQVMLRITNMVADAILTIDALNERPTFVE